MLLRSVTTRRAPEHRVLLVCGAEAVVRDLRAQVVDVVEVGVADHPGERAGELRGRSCPAARRARTATSSARLVVGVLVLVLDVEHPRGRSPRRRPGSCPGSAGRSASRRARSSRPPRPRARRWSRRRSARIFARHAALREAALEQEDEARADEQHQQRVAVEAVAEPARRATALSYSASVIVLISPDAALVEVAGVRVVDGGAGAATSGRA